MFSKKYAKPVLAITVLLALVMIGVLPALAAPINDDISNATQIFDVPYYDFPFTTDATSAPDDPNPTCNYYGGREATVWYLYNPVISQVSIASAAGSSYTTVIGVYTGAPGALSEIACATDNIPVSFQTNAGENYYIMVADVGMSPYPGPDPGQYGGYLNFSLTESAEPVADFDYMNAPEFGLFAVYFNNWSYDPNCSYCYLDAVWDFGDGMIDTQWNPIHQFPADGSYTVTLTVSTQDGRTAQSQKQVDVVTPPPDASFSFYPYDPSIYDMVFFNYWACYWCTVQWDFGDGATSTEMNPYHQYAADGDYTVELTATAPDGQSASSNQVVEVKTVDVAITRFNVPNSAHSGQTRSVTVELNNTTYPVEVEVQLFKSNGQGWDWIGSLQQTVPVRASNRTTGFEFSYTFTAADAQLGTLNFRAVANIYSGRDAFPTNNEAISLPTKVNH